MGIIQFSNSEERENFIDEKEKRKLKWLLQIVYDAYDLKGVFSEKDLKTLWDVRSEINLRKQYGPFKRLTASWEIWRSVIPMTWHLPKALAKWEREPGKKWLDDTYQALRETLDYFFSEGGKYVLSQYHNPHRAVITKKYAPLHYHGVLSTVRFNIQDKKKVNGKSKVDRWKEKNWMINSHSYKNFSIIQWSR